MGEFRTKRTPYVTRVESRKDARATKENGGAMWKQGWGCGEGGGEGNAKHERPKEGAVGRHKEIERNRTTHLTVGDLRTTAFLDDVLGGRGCLGSIQRLLLDNFTTLTRFRRKHGSHMIWRLSPLPRAAWGTDTSAVLCVICAAAGGAWRW